MSRYLHLVLLLLLINHAAAQYICPVGTTGINGLCYACDTGTYKSTSGSTPCINCEAGTYSPNVGASTSTTCIPCPSGQNSPPASPMCGNSLAIPGEYTAVGPTCEASRVRTQCCSFGSFQDSSTSGTLSDGTGYPYPYDNNCTWIIGPSSTISFTFSMFDLAKNDRVILYSCPDSQCNSKNQIGSFAGNGPPVLNSPHVVTTGYMQLEFVTGPSNLNRGFLGTWNAVLLPAIRPCPAGTYSSTFGAAVCTECPSAKYSATVGATSAETCLACPANSLSGSRSVSCLCNPGYKLSPGSLDCTLCVAGTYKYDYANTECSNCRVNQYSTIVGSTTWTNCLACPAGSTSPVASSACVCNIGYEGGVA